MLRATELPQRFLKLPSASESPSRVSNFLPKWCWCCCPEAHILKTTEQNEGTPIYKCMKGQRSRVLVEVCTLDRQSFTSSNITGRERDDGKYKIDLWWEAEDLAISMKDMWGNQMRVERQTGAYKFGNIGKLFSYIVGIKQTVVVGIQGSPHLRFETENIKE